MGGAKGMFGVLGLLMMFFGSIWILQGVNVSWAPQSFMTSDITWTYRGVGLALIGLVLLLGAARRGGWRDVLGAVGALAAFLGAIFVAQATNVLPGMPMSGNMDWAIRGGVVLAVGIVLVFIGARRGVASAA